MDSGDWRRWWESRGAAGLRSVLMERWDPIGVDGIPQAGDEYDTYLVPLAEALRDGADARAVAEHLAEVQTERMGLPKSAEELLPVGESVIAWYSAETGP